MKDYREMAENVLQRRDAYRINRRNNMRKAVSVMSAFCIVVVLSAGVWYGVILTNIDSEQIRDVQPQNIVNRDTDDGADRPTAEQETQQNSGQENEEVSVQETQKSAINDLSANKNDGESSKSEDSGTNDNDSSMYSNSGVAKPTGTETTIDTPVSDIPGDTGALTAYDEVWGGCYMDKNGCWVVWLTEDTPENRQEVFIRNPSLNEDNTVFKTAAYSKAYLTYLMNEISNAMCAGKLPLVTTAALREDKNRVEVTMISDDPWSVDKVLAFDTVGGAIEIIYDSEMHVIMDLEEYGIMDLSKESEP